MSTLEIASIIGNSVSDSRCVSISQNVVAYVASGGVVVCDLDPVSGKVKRQRFFSPDPRESCSNDQESDQLLDSRTNSHNLSFLRSKTRTISCVALSRDCQWLAIGESGYLPRVLVYSLQKESASPVQVGEYQFGLSCVGFSECSRYLGALGVPTDGTIGVWRLKVKTGGLLPVLAASNRCNSSVNGMKWIGDRLVTYGLRHARVWRLDGGAVLRGKSVLFGALLNENFIYMDHTNQELFFYSESGTFSKASLVDLELHRIGKYSNPGAFHLEAGTVYFGGGTLPLDLFDDGKYPDLRESPSTISISKHEDLVITVDVNGVISVAGQAVNSPSLKFVIGAKQSKDCLQLWSEYGDYWTLCPQLNLKKGFHQLESYSSLENKLTAMAISDSKERIFGDRYGVLSIEDSNYSEKIHASAINDACFMDLADYSFLITVSRDRTVQVLYKDKTGSWDLLQTLKPHKANIIQILTHENRFLTCSIDRTISIHSITLAEEGPLIRLERSIALKSTPVTSCIHGLELVVLSSDKTISFYDLHSYNLRRCHKIYSEGVSLMAETMIPFGKLLACSFSDKSVRLVNPMNGKTEAEASAHASTVVGLGVVDSKLVSVSLDGCVFAWNVKEKEEPPKPEEVRRVVRRPSVSRIKVKATLRREMTEELAKKPVIKPKTPITTGKTDLEKAIDSTLRSFVTLRKALRGLQASPKLHALCKEIDAIQIELNQICQSKSRETLECLKQHDFRDVLERNIVLYSEKLLEAMEKQRK